MAPDFPASPTVGQTYTAPSGLVYTWDGKVWTTTGPLSGTPAGGALTGTYPNPTLATGVIAPAIVRALPAGVTLTTSDQTVATLSVNGYAGRTALVLVSIGVHGYMIAGSLPGTNIAATLVRASTGAMTAMPLGTYLLSASAVNMWSAATIAIFGLATALAATETFTVTARVGDTNFNASTVAGQVDAYIFP